MRIIPARHIQCDDVMHFEGGDYRVLNYTFAVLPGYAQECVSIYLQERGDVVVPADLMITVKRP